MYLMGNARWNRWKLSWQTQKPDKAINSLCQKCIRIHIVYHLSDSWEVRSGTVFSAGAGCLCIATTTSNSLLCIQIHFAPCIAVHCNITQLKFKDRSEEENIVQFTNGNHIMSLWLPARAKGCCSKSGTHITSMKCTTFSD